jgi:hypothetical protein
VEAKDWNFRTRNLARLQERVFGRNVDLFAVDDELGHAACPPVAPQRAVFHICAVNHEPCWYLPLMPT